MIIQSAGQLEQLKPAWTPAVSTSVLLYDRYYYDYATLYRVQPNVRVCVDFLARNIAQLGLHVFRRLADGDRQRLRDHPLAQLIEQPLPAEYKVTRYRLIESIMSDLGIYYNAYLLKIRDGRRVVGLLRIPPDIVTVSGYLTPQSYTINFGTKTIEFAPSEIIHFRGYNADSAVAGLSPLETLRRVLAEEAAAGDYRESFWRNAARPGGIIERPATAPGWSETARRRFKEEFEQLYSGSLSSGRTIVLEEGMTWKNVAFNPQEAEYLGGRKLTREECARAYHIPLPMVGILDHATFSNIREQHKNLYQDCLGPWLAMLEQDFELQLLPDFENTENVYLEFNIQEKLAGAFEEQVQALQAAVGRPWMTADEARQRLNLPSLGGDAAELPLPMNLMTGDGAPGGESEQEAAAALLPEAKSRRASTHAPLLLQREREKRQRVLVRHFRRQEAAITSGLKRKDALPGGTWWDAERWNRELADDLLELDRDTALLFAQRVLDEMGADSGVSTERMESWLREHARIASEGVNGAIYDALAKALSDPNTLDAVKHVFEIALTTQAARLAWDMVLGVAHFGAHEGARAGGARWKRWRVNSGNPRDEHAALNGETVRIDDNFSNGMRWPGDPAGGAENNANCQCSVEFGR